MTTAANQLLSSTSLTASNDNHYIRLITTGYSDESGLTTLTYDEPGNLTVKARTIGSESYTTTYTYDKADKLTQAVYPSGRIVTYTYDGVGQISGVSTKSGGTTTTLASSVAYYPFGSLKYMAYGNGLTTSFLVLAERRLRHVGCAFEFRWFYFAGRRE